jgi:hypothetical protein
MSEQVLIPAGLIDPVPLPDSMHADPASAADRPWLMKITSCAMLYLDMSTRIHKVYFRNLRNNSTLRLT